jgi:hypothetical protein
MNIKMKIELKNVSYNAKLSQETSAFTASIYIDGVKRGTVSNSGTGGPNNIFPWSLSDEINKYAKTLPGITYAGQTFPRDADIVIGDILNSCLSEQKLKKLLKTRVVLVKDGKCYTCKGVPKSTEGYIILNTLSFDKALEKYIECTSEKL